ncbi:hypothetical protein EG68_10709 [Paragonimus skrjabini miyazakii]|uniref:Uncharacterized protein n=1 Tax=Paragonimus skrjabini miyazakii TaxID=59628 RepID=A0A8S9YFL3_9TREM|nr:hypothetical protein EG68_10709 [Paragonimus skrjabini miyazakii]
MYWIHWFCSHKLFLLWVRMKYEQLGILQDLSLAVHLILTLTITCVSMITQNITLNSVGVIFSERAYSNLKTSCLAILITQCILLIIELALSVLKLDRWYLKSSLSQTLFSTVVHTVGFLFQLVFFDVLALKHLSALFALTVVPPFVTQFIALIRAAASRK